MSLKLDNTIISNLNIGATKKTAFQEQSFSIAEDLGNIEKGVEIEDDMLEPEFDVDLDTVLEPKPVSSLDKVIAMYGGTDDDLDDEWDDSDDEELEYEDIDELDEVEYVDADELDDFDDDYESDEETETEYCYDNDDDEEEEEFYDGIEEEEIEQVSHKVAIPKYDMEFDDEEDEEDEEEFDDDYIDNVDDTVDYDMYEDEDEEDDYDEPLVELKTGIVKAKEPVYEADSEDMYEDDDDELDDDWSDDDYEFEDDVDSEELETEVIEPKTVGVITNDYIDYDDDEEEEEEWVDADSELDADYIEPSFEDELEIDEDDEWFDELDSEETSNGLVTSKNASEKAVFDYSDNTAENIGTEDEIESFGDIENIAGFEDELDDNFMSLYDDENDEEDKPVKSSSKLSDTIKCSQPKNLGNKNEEIEHKSSNVKDKSIDSMSTTGVKSKLDEKTDTIYKDGMTLVDFIRASGNKVTLDAVKVYFTDAEIKKALNSFLVLRKNNYLII